MDSNNEQSPSSSVPLGKMPQEATPSGAQADMGSSIGQQSGASIGNTISPSSLGAVPSSGPTSTQSSLASSAPADSSSTSASVNSSTSSIEQPFTANPTGPAVTNGLPLEESKNLADTSTEIVAPSGIGDPATANSSIIPNMPAGQDSPQSVAFNDPAVSTGENQTEDSKVKKTRSSKMTLVVLIVVAVMVVIALVGVLILQLMNKGSNSGGPASVAISERTDPDKEQGGSGSVNSNLNATIVCDIVPIEEDERIIEGKIFFKIENNKLSEAEIKISFVNENGENGTLSEVMPLTEIFGSDEGEEIQDNELVSSDGTLKVGTDVLAEKLTNYLSEVDNGNTYSCTVTEE